MVSPEIRQGMAGADSSLKNGARSTLYEHDADTIKTSGISSLMYFIRFLFIFISFFYKSNTTDEYGPIINLG